MARKNAVSFEDFDPNVPSSKQPIWAVYTPGTFRTYPVRGHAINRFHRNNQAKLYEWDLGAGRWIERAVKGVAEPPTVCSGCQQSTIETRQKWDYQRRPDGRYVRVDTGETYDVNPGSFQFERHGGKISNPVTLLFLCEECAEINQHA